MNEPRPARRGLKAHHFALTTAVLAIVFVVLPMASRSGCLGELEFMEAFWPSTAGGWGAGHRVRTFGLLTDAEGVLANRSEMEGALELAKAVLRGEETEAEDHAALTAFEGRRVWLTVYGITFPGPVSSGKGDNLYESIVDAAENLRDDSKTKWAKRDPAEFRVRLDVVNRVMSKKLKEDVYLPPRESVGTWGMLMENEEGQVTFLTEGEIVEQGLYDNKKRGLPTKKVTERLEARAGLGTMILPTTPFTRFYTRSYVEGPAGEGIVELYRNHVIPNDEATREHLAPSARAAADYIARIIDERGKHNYKYFPVQDRDSASYNMLRHGGTTYALMQAYDRFRDPEYKEAAERSFEYLLGRTELREDPGPWGPNYRFIIEERKAKLGGSGLALVAMCQYTEATGDMRYMEEMKEFARFIVKMQDPESGKLISYFDYGPTAQVPSEDSIYYPGEALYGLGKFYFIDKNPLWLETANKGAYWLIFDRDKDKEPIRLPHDHWLMMALSYMYAHTGDEAYQTHCLNIASAVEHKFRNRDHDMVEDYPDYLGTFYKLPNVTPVGCRVEGLVGTVDLCKLAGIDYRQYLNMAGLSAGFSMTLQFDPVNSFYLPNPRKALGGFKESIVQNPIRNDYVQHNLSGLIGVERHLAEADGVELPGGPAWGRDKVARGIVFGGAVDDFPQPGEPLYHIPYAGEDDVPLRVPVRGMSETEPEPESESESESETEPESESESETEAEPARGTDESVDEDEDE